MLTSFRTTYPSSTLLSACGQLCLLEAKGTWDTSWNASFFSSSPHFARVFGNVKTLEELSVRQELFSLHSIIPLPGLRTLNRVYVTPENVKTSDELIIMFMDFIIQISEVELGQRTSGLVHTSKPSVA